MKKKVLLSSLLLTTLLVDTSNAYDLSQKVYGRTGLQVGYALQFLGGKDIKDLRADNDNNALMVGVLNLKLDSSVYFKKYDNFHPFIGLDINGRIPTTKDDIIDMYVAETLLGGHVMTIGTEVKDFYKIKDFLSINFKLGVKCNLRNKLSLSPYALIGLNLIQASSKGYVGFNDEGEMIAHSPDIEVRAEEATTKYNLSHINAGLSVGAGIGLTRDIAKHVALTASLEYQYHYHKGVKTVDGLVLDKYGGQGENSEINYMAHQFSANIGIQFM